jgi:hypothetical protein
MVMMIVALLVCTTSFYFPQGNSTTVVTLGFGWRITIYSVVVMMTVLSSRQESVGIHDQLLFPTRHLYQIRDFGLGLEDYHLQRELEASNDDCCAGENFLVYTTSFYFSQGNSTTFLTPGSGWRITIYSVNWEC